MNFIFIILTFLISAVIARILIPRILLISLRKKLFDIPDDRKIHKRAIPRLGGVSFFPTTLFAFCLVYAFRLLDGDSSLWGTTWVADMSNGYVGIGYGEDGAAQQVPDDVKTAVEELSKKIVSGEIFLTRDGKRLSWKCIW